MPDNLQVGEIRIHPSFGRVQLVAKNDPAGLVQYVPVEGAQEYSCTVFMWEGWPLWEGEPDLSHLPTGESGAWRWRR